MHISYVYDTGDGDDGGTTGDGDDSGNTGDDSGNAGDGDDSGNIYHDCTPQVFPTAPNILVNE